jgi:SAM-dependent methyltransferase
MSEMNYKVSAHYYDSAYASKADLTDLPFYLEEARQSTGPVLELACGTGRITLPIAREGIEICGVDRAPAMLEKLRDKLKQEDKGVRQRLEVTKGDMRNCRLGRRFALVIIPFRAMQHMYSIDDQVAALETAKAHLAPDGRLVFDVFMPRLDKIYGGLGDEHFELEWEQDGHRIRRYFCKDSSDILEQSFTGRFIFRAYRGEELVSEESDVLKMGFYTYKQVQLLVKHVGLEVVAEYGDFDRRSLGPEGPQMIFALKAKD